MPPKFSSSICRYSTVAAAIVTISFGSSSTVLAQLPEDIPRRDVRPSNIIPRIVPPSEERLPEETPIPPLPEDLFQSPDRPLLEPDTREAPQAVYVEGFAIDEEAESTVFDQDNLVALAWRVALLPDDENLDENIRAAVDQVAADECPKALEESNQDIGTDATDAIDETDASEGTNDHRDSSENTSDLESQETQAGTYLTFEQLLRARSAITQLYITCGYITSGAILPVQTPADRGNVVRIQIVEGSLEDIIISFTGRNRLNQSYIRSRLNLAASTPLNQRRLLQGLQLLQLDPLIRRISAELQTGTRPGTNILQVTVDEVDSPFTATLALNNNRSPSVGSFERGIRVNQSNLTGLGDGFNFAYNNTDGSNGIETNYTLPINPRDGTLSLAYGYTESDVVESPFDVLGIEATSRYYELTARQPIVRTPNREIALGLTFSRQESQTELSFDDIGPFPLSPGADKEGRTEISALRFTQEWFQRNNRQVLAARSQFSLGVDWFDATVHDEAPDSRFFAWRGQGQWARLLNDDGLLLLVRADVQLTGDALVPLEQFGLGGQTTVRGYRQDALLTDNGALATAEMRFRVVRSDEQQDGLFVVPFFDIGKGWNVESNDPDPDTLIGTGIGLLWQENDLLHNGDYIYARFDWGIPLVSDDTRNRTWQESGVYFSIEYSPF